MLTDNKVASQLLRLAVETSPDAMILAREDGTISFANRQAARLFGYQPEELLDLTIEELVPARQRKKHARHRESYLANPTVRPMGAIDTDVELRGLRQDGTEFPADVSLSYLETEEGLTVAAAVRNASERRRSEEAQLLTSYLDTILLNLPVGVAILEGPDFRYFRINKMLADLNGLAIEDHLGKPLAEVLPDSSNILTNLRKVRTESKPILNREFSTRLPSDPDQEVHLMDFHFPISVAGQVRAVGAVVLDVTARKRAEKELQKAHDELERRVAERTAELEATNSELRQLGESLRDREASLRLLVETTHLIPWEADAQTWQFTYVGPQAEEILGHPVERWYECDFWVKQIHPEDQKFAIDFCTESSKNRSDYDFEYRMLAADGRVVWLHDIVNVVSENGRPHRLRGFMIDITERKRLEAKLRELSDKLAAENVVLRQELEEFSEPADVVGRSDIWRHALYQAKQVASTDATVLITGETGTGKDVVAHVVHRQSSRRDRRLLKVNCAALPATLIESELFGHDKGAFTGATTAKAGRFELADGATIFLDEIGDLPLELQPKLLRVLQDGEFERLGSTKTRKVDVRVIAATNRNLQEAIAEGKFRRDLYYRLSVFPLELPPLRERPEDIPLLVWYFLRELGARHGREIAEVSREAMNALGSYTWPGNVRELQNVLERALILSPGSRLLLASDFAEGPTLGSSKSTVQLEDLVRSHILRVVEECGWQIRGKGNAAERLGINPSTLRSRLKKLGIERPRKSRRSGAGSSGELDARGKDNL